MKFLCIKCDEMMSLKKVEEDSRKSIGLTFHCSKCNSSFAMLTNPMETQLVKSMGLAIGEKKKSPSPAEMMDDSLSGGEQPDALRWEPDAEERLKKVPAIARSMARAAIVRSANDKGVKLITTAFMDEVKKEVH